MAKRFWRSAAFLASLLAVAAAGIAQQPAGAQQLGGAPGEIAPPIRIGAGDLVEVQMFENPDLSGRFRVDERGDITIPLLGAIHVVGETAEEAAVQIERRFVQAQILQPGESHATIFIAEYASQGITVTGEVRSAGVFPALGVRMLNDVISAAGGVNPTASSQLIITHKRDPEHRITVEYNPTALTPVIPQVQIFPGDTILVPRAGVIYAVGNINRPGVYVLDGRRPLTVEELMGLAGGTGHAAAVKRVQLVRTLDGGRREAITIPVNLIYKGRAPDVALIDGDILYVPTSTSKLITEQVINSAVGIGTSFAVYRVANQSQ